MCETLNKALRIKGEKMKKRILSGILAALLLAASLTSCSDSGTNEETSKDASQGSDAAVDVAAEDETAEPTRQSIPDNLPDRDFDGREYRVCTEERKVFEILSEEMTGEATNDAVFDRNVRIEDRFDCKITTIANSAPQDDVVKTVTAGVDAYEIVGYVNFLTYTPVGAKVLYNWCDVPFVDLDQPWHNKLANDPATINGKLFSINSDLSISTLQYTYGMFFNYAIMERYGYTSDGLYDIVFEGKWTVDKLREITGGIWEDVNGDGKHDVNDIHGYSATLSGINTHDVWLAALDLPVITINSCDDFEITFYCEKTMSALEKVCQLYHNTEGSFLPNVDWRQIPANFANGTIGMSQLYFGETTESLTEMEDAYGILPLPKFDETQEGYYTNAWDQFTVFGVPLTMSDPEFTGIIYEVLSAEAYKYVFPAYYDVALKSRYSAEAKTAEIVDLIMAGRKLEFAFQFGNKFADLPYKFRQMVTANTTDVASAYKKIEKVMKKSIQKVLEVYAD